MSEDQPQRPDTLRSLRQRLEKLADWFAHVQEQPGTAKLLRDASSALASPPEGSRGVSGSESPLSGSPLANVSKPPRSALRNGSSACPHCSRRLQLVQDNGLVLLALASPPAHDERTKTALTLDEIAHRAAWRATNDVDLRYFDAFKAIVLDALREASATDSSSLRAGPVVTTPQPRIVREFEQEWLESTEYKALQEIRKYLGADNQNVVDGDLVACIRDLAQVAISEKGNAETLEAQPQAQEKALTTRTAGTSHADTDETGSYQKGDSND